MMTYVETYSPVYCMQSETRPTKVGQNTGDGEQLGANNLLVSCD